MTTKTISAYSSGFTFSPGYSELTVTATGTVGGTGVTSGTLAAYTIANSGTIEGQGSSLGVFLQDGGLITNGSASDTTALISGVTGIRVGGAAGTVQNDGTVEGIGATSLGIYLAAGGAVSNGAANDVAAAITGRSVGVSVANAAGTIVNYGIIEGARSRGILLAAGGIILNGSGSDTTALIEGYVGVEAAGAATVTNYGSIDGTGGTALEFDSSAGKLVVGTEARFVGRVLGDGGTLVLAAGGTGTLSGLGTSFSGFGQVGVAAGASWTLAGNGTIAANAVLTNDGSLVVDGDLVDLGSLAGGVDLLNGTLGIGAAGAVTATGTAVAGSPTSLDTVDNLGLVSASGVGSVGIQMNGEGIVTDGSAGNAVALIEGAVGVVLAGPGDILSYGSIVGTGGTAVELLSASDLLTIESSARFGGNVVADGGTLELAGATGTGSLNGLGTSFTGFATVEVDPDSAWTLNGSATANTLSNAGALTVTDGISIEDGLVNQTGAALMVTGRAIYGSGGGITLTNRGAITASGAGDSAIELGQGGTVVNFGYIGAASAAPIEFLSSADVLVIEAGSSFGGVSNLGGGTLALGAGTAGGVLSGLGSTAPFTNFATLEVEKGATWTLTGTNFVSVGVALSNEGTLLNGGTVTIAGTMLPASGIFTNGSYGDRSALVIGEIVLGGAATLTNFGTLDGAVGAAVEFQSDQDVLVLKAGAVIEGGGNLGGGTLILEGSAGTLTGLGSATGLSDFGKLEFAETGWSLVGSNTIGSGVTISVDGLVLSGTLTNEGRLTTNEAQGMSIAGTLINRGRLVSKFTSESVYTESGLVGMGFITIHSGGIAIGSAQAIVNYGAIESNGGYGGTAIRLSSGATVTNGAAGHTNAQIVATSNGVEIAGGAGTVVNFGLIQTTGRSTVYESLPPGYSVTRDTGGHAILLGAGGLVVNGDAGDTRATIESAYGISISGGAGTIENFGVIDAFSGNYTRYRQYSTAIALADGGMVTNGSSDDTGAVIDGSVVISGTVGTVANFGTIRSGQISIAAAGGLLVNGSNGDTDALIAGTLDLSHETVVSAYTVRNFGTITGSAIDSNDLVNGSSGDLNALISVTEGLGASVLDNFGTVSVGAAASSTAIANGSARDTGALIHVLGDITSVETLTNFGRMTSAGVYLESRARVANGSADDLSATISGHFNGIGVLYDAVGASVYNFGTVVATSASPVNGNRPSAIHILSYGRVTNGSNQDELALVAGYIGIDVSENYGTVDNFGTITGAGSTGGVGVLLHEFGRISNGTADDPNALIRGFVGASLGEFSTVTNFGTIEGTGGTALEFHGSGDRLVVEGGAVFDGRVIGGGGTLELDLAGGAGIVTGIGVAGTDDGFTGFAEIMVVPGAHWTLTGANVVTAGTALVNDGSLTVTGTLTSLGSLSGHGTIALAGHASFTAENAVGHGQEIAFTGGGETLALSDPAGFRASLAGFGQGDTLDLTSFGFGTAEHVHFDENSTGTAGTLVITDGSMRFAATLFGQYAAAGFSLTADGYGGTDVRYTPITTAVPLQLATATH